LTEEIDRASSSLCVLGLDLSAIDRVNRNLALCLDSDACASSGPDLVAHLRIGFKRRKVDAGSSMCSHHSKFVRNKSDLGFLPVICSVIYFVLFSPPNMADQAYTVNVLSYQLLSAPLSP
jgi:hypothetical protein